MKKLLLASVFSTASIPGYAHAQTLPTLTFSGCTDKNGNEGLLYWVGLEPRCGLSPAKPKLIADNPDRGCETIYQRNTPEYEACIADDQEPPASPSPPARVTVAPPYQGPPPIGWVYGPYIKCAAAVPVPPGCFMWAVNVPADGLNVRTVPNGPPVMALVNETLVVPIRREGNWLLVAAGCDLTPTFAWSWTAGVPLNRCWVYF